MFYKVTLILIYCHDFDKFSSTPLCPTCFDLGDWLLHCEVKSVLASYLGLQPHSINLVLFLRCHLENFAYESALCEFLNFVFVSCHVCASYGIALAWDELSYVSWKPQSSILFMRYLLSIVCIMSLILCSSQFYVFHQCLLDGKC